MPIKTKVSVKLWYELEWSPKGYNDWCPNPARNSTLEGIICLLAEQEKQNNKYSDYRIVVKTLTTSVLEIPVLEPANKGQKE